MWEVWEVWIYHLSGQNFPRKIGMASQRGVVLKHRVSRPCKVCVPAECSMEKSMNAQGEKSVMIMPSVLCHFVLVCNINTKTMKIDIKK